MSPRRPAGAGSREMCHNLDSLDAESFIYL